MILSALRRYLQDRGQATLAEIALHFEVDPEVARQMLGVWQRKGRVHKRRVTASCGTSCSQCDPAATEIYVWGESAPVQSATCQVRSDPLERLKIQR